MPQTIAFRMQLKPGTLAEYQRRHDAIWPELADLLHQAGISDYRIFADEATLALFATLSLADGNLRDALPHHPVMRRWWEHMAELMETDATYRPLEWPLLEVFHLP